MKFEECQEEEMKLRDAYINAPPLPRLGVIKQRLNTPDSKPNRLITLVSAVEAFSRSILLSFAERDGIGKDKKYEEIKRERARYMLTMICNDKSIERPESIVFGEENFENFQCAEKYRDLLVHEATYLSQGISIDLIESAEAILNTLEAICRNEWREPVAGGSN